MSWLEHIRAAYRYNKWANDRILDAASRVNDEDLVRKRLSSKGSIAADLKHIVSTQQNWFSVLVGEDRPADWNPARTDVIATLRNHYDASHERIRVYSARLTDDDLERVIRVSRGGKDYDFIPWQILFHLANHGTQHRAEVGIALLSLDASPGDLDAVYFFGKD
jgi:uncharacterized damage-inducible protein DinB